MVQKSILIADDDRELVDALRLRCLQLGLRVFTAHDSLSALQTAIDRRPDLLCVDVEMPRGNGLGVCEMLAAESRTASIPVIVLTGKATESVIRHCHKLCAYYVLKGGDAWGRVGPLIREVLGLAADEGLDSTDRGSSRTGVDRCQCLVENVFALLGCDPDYLQVEQNGPRRPRGTNAERDVPWVLCIDDDSDFTWVLKRRLEDHGLAVVRAFDGADGYRTAFADRADVILLDYEMPNGHGDYVLSRLRENSLTRDIPVVVLTGRRDRDLEQRMLGLGASAFLHKPIEFSRLKRVLARYVDLVPEVCL